MKKIISLLLCALITLFCFTGCSEKQSEYSYDTATMQQISEAILTSFASMAETDFEQFEVMSDFQLDYTMMASSLPIEANDFRIMMDTWQLTVAENGAYISHDAYEVSVKNNGVVLSTDVKFEDTEATVSFKFDEKSNLVSLDVAGQMSIGMIFKKAGLNTILGMGVVFLVLILLAFVIYLMKFIPQLVEQKEAKEEVFETFTSEIEEVSSECMDDLELVAVITAAIAAQEGKSTDGFVVRSIRRRPSNHWN